MAAISFPIPVLLATCLWAATTALWAKPPVSEAELYEELRAAEAHRELEAAVAGTASCEQAMGKALLLVREQRTRISELEADNLRLREQCPAQAQVQPEDPSAAIRQEYERRLRTLGEQNRRLSEELAQAKATREPLERQLQAANDEQRRLTEALTLANTERQRLEQQLQAVSEGQRRLNDELTQLKAGGQQLEQRLAQQGLALDNARNRIAGLNQHLHQQTLENQRLGQGLQQAQACCQANTTQRTALREALAGIRNTAASLQEQVEALPEWR